MNVSKRRENKNVLNARNISTENISGIKFVYFLEIEDGIIQPFMVKLKVYLMIIRKSGS